MKKICAILLLIGIAVIVQSGDLTIKSGYTFKNYVIMGAAPTGIKVFYNNGDGDRQVILPVNEFPDDLRDTVNKLAKNIPAAKKAAQDQARQQKEELAARKKENRAAAARQKKSAALVKKEQDENQKLQEKIKKRTPASSKNRFFKNSSLK